MAFYDEESLESLPLRLFLAFFFSLAGVARGIYGLRETHYSGIVKMVDVVVSSMKMCRCFHRRVLDDQ